MTQLKPSTTEDNSDSNQSLDIDSRISPWLARMLYPLGCYAIIPLFFGKIEVMGRENIPQQDSVIVAPTHRSRWDAFLVPYAVGRMVSGRDLRFMVSANEVRGIQGWVVRRMGGFPVDTENPKISSVRHSIELLREDDEMLVIFPEGGIYRENFIQPLKRGVALIALEAETAKSDRHVKILPISIRYSQSIPTWGTDVKINIGKPLTVADYLSNSLRKSSRQLTADLQTSLEKLYENQHG
jgi:1-acyl-sn-glycerol-3-phosphate acyltransferase